MAKEGNYEIFKMDALRRFLTFDQEEIIRRMHLENDENYIYIDYMKYAYRFSRKAAMLERLEEKNGWVMADVNETLTLCDLLCHTKEPIHLAGDFLSLQSLNRVKGGTTQTTLAKGMFHEVLGKFDQKDALLKTACESLGGVPAGKGDVAYEIPVFGPIHVRLSFYHSDDEFEAQMTVLFPADICQYLHYETLYYLTGSLLERLENLCFH